VDFGLSHLETEGVQVLTMVQTGRISVKCWPCCPTKQSLSTGIPCGRRPGERGDHPGGVRHGVFLRSRREHLEARLSGEGKEKCYTLRHEIILKPGDQITFQPGEKHWFQARDEGAVMYSFSSVARDALDQFTDPDIIRM